MVENNKKSYSLQYNYCLLYFSFAFHFTKVIKIIALLKGDWELVGM